MTRTTGFRRDAANLHMAKPYIILHAPQVRFIEKSSPRGALRNEVRLSYIRLTASCIVLRTSGIMLRIVILPAAV